MKTLKRIWEKLLAVLAVCLRGLAGLDGRPVADRSRPVSRARLVRETWRPRKKRKRQPNGLWWAPGRVYAAPVDTPPDSPLWKDIGAVNEPLNLRLEVGQSYELHYSFGVPDNGSWPAQLPFGVSGGSYPKREVVWGPPRTGKSHVSHNYAVQCQNQPLPTVATPEEDE